MNGVVNDRPAYAILGLLRSVDIVQWAQPTMVWFFDTGHDLGVKHTCSLRMDEWVAYSPPICPLYNHFHAPVPCNVCVQAAEQRDMAGDQARSVDSAKWPHGDVAHTVWSVRLRQSAVRQLRFIHCRRSEVKTTKPVSLLCQSITAG